MLTGVTSAVNFMGIDDVIEILKAIRNDRNVAVQDCRPLKVKVWPSDPSPLVI